jgi:biotin-[acetyl-CoA-carboxylase] ligase BirA-like protein
MLIYMDDTGWAQRFFPHAADWRPGGIPLNAHPAGLEVLAEQFFENSAVLEVAHLPVIRNAVALGVSFSSFSQFDRVVELIGRGHRLPDRLFCLAGSGLGFHGQRRRPWVAAEGNIHLTAHYRPETAIPGFAVGFPLLAAVSVLETLDQLAGLAGRATVKWINDILIDAAKVAGFIVHIQTQGDQVTSAVLGIGLNVEAKPQLETDSFVPQVTALCEVVRDPGGCSLGKILSLLLAKLEANYQKLCRGDLPALLRLYRSRSTVIGRQVRVVSDPLEGPTQVLAEGRVMGIGDRLELLIQGCERRVTRGRLIMLDKPSRQTDKPA